MSKISINNLNAGNVENLVIGDNNIIHSDKIIKAQRLMEEINKLHKTVGESNNELNAIVNQLQRALSQKDYGKFYKIFNVGKDFLLQLAANYSAICLDNLINL